MEEEPRPNQNGAQDGGDENSNQNNNNNRRRRRDDNNLPNRNEIEEEDPQVQRDEEAVEDREPEDNDADDEDEADGEDLMENMDKDYEPIPELDNYERDGIDDREFEPMEEEQKREADDALRRRDIEALAANKRVPTAMLDDQESDLEDDLRDALRRSRQRAQEADLALDEGEDEEGDERHLSIDEVKGKLPEWINEPRTQRWIRRSFKKFLLNFKDQNGVLLYENRINEMCANNKQSLEINPTHLQRMYPSILLWILESPTLVLPLLNAVAFDLAKHFFPGYENIHSEIYVRMKEWPILTELRDLRKLHLNQMIKIIGVVTRRGAVYSQLKKVYYICNRCGQRLGPLFVNEHSQDSVHLGACQACQAKGPFQIDSEFTIYRNYQRITVQETPGKVPPGRVPRHKDVILLADNIDVARPGDEVELVGIFTNQLDYALNVKHGFPVFSTIIEANCMRRVAESQITDLPDEEKYEIRKLAKTHPNVGRLIINSIAPSIYGHNHVKTALALAMFGGEAKDWAGKHRIRGDINCLVLGDPGTAKSQFLKYIEKTFHRCVYTTGKGASAVGLTALVHRDPSTREWTLEGGALVLADKGICLIDEFDKMSDHDRTSIHEAMEQQTISISKAGIIANLQARCSVIAAANPIKGRYDPQLSFGENVDLSDTILSRFDILAVVKDEVDLNTDTALATFVINSHIKSHPNVDKGNLETVKDSLLEDTYGASNNLPMISQDLLKKYILYARQFVKPQLTEINKEKITNFFAHLRQESQASGGIPVYHRHLEALIRMAEAHARMHLRDNVRDDDVDVAISVLLESFIQTQKVSVAKLIRRKFSSYLTYKDENTFLLLNLLNKLIREKIQYKQLVRSPADSHEVKVLREELEEAARELQIFDLS